MNLKKKQELARTWRGPKAVCVCGHSGDGTESDHRDGCGALGSALGHGACTVEGCRCRKFTWKGFTARFGKALATESGCDISFGHARMLRAHVAFSSAFPAYAGYPEGSR